MHRSCKHCLYAVPTKLRRTANRVFVNVRLSRPDEAWSSDGEGNEVSRKRGENRSAKKIESAFISSCLIQNRATTSWLPCFYCGRVYLLCPRSFSLRPYIESSSHYPNSQDESHTAVASFTIDPSIQRGWRSSVY